MALALTYDEVKALQPCSGSFNRVVRLLGGKSGWSGNKISAADARKAGCVLDRATERLCNRMFASPARIYAIIAICILAVAVIEKAPI